MECTRILMNVRDVIEEPELYLHGTTLVHCISEEQQMESKITLAHMLDNQFALALNINANEQTFVPGPHETLEDVYNSLMSTISCGKLIWVGEAIPNSNAGVIRLTKKLNKIIDEAKLPDYIVTNNGHVDIDDTMKTVLKETFKQLMVPSIVDNL